MAGRTEELVIGAPGPSERKPTLEALCERENICQGCALRYGGCRDTAKYAVAGRLKVTHVCAVCLGVLQKPALSSTVTQGTEELANVQHAGTFKVNVALPPAAALLREASTTQWMREAGADVSADVVSLREAFKLAVCSLIESSAGVVYHPDAETFIDVKCSHAETARECSLITPDGAAVGRGKPSGSARQAKRNGTGPAPGKRPRGGSIGVGEAKDGSPEDVEYVEGPSIVSTRRAIEACGPEELRKLLGSAFFPPKAPNTAVEVTLAVSVAAFLVAGTYNKLSRRISQTPWYLNYQPDIRQKGRSKDPLDGHPGMPLDDHDAIAESERGERHSEISVEDVVVAGLHEVFKPTRTTFTAGGREDIDVRMLGRGRPFIVDVINPCIVQSRVTPAMIATARACPHPGAGLVVMNDLRIVPRSYAAQMRACEVDKRKHYRCVVWIARALDESFVRSRLEEKNISDGLLLHQKTPLRVLHRRTLLVRQRRILRCTVVRFVTPNTFVLDVIAAAGTYIKEFVHSDNGRTKPSVAKLLDCEADILQLDVAEVDFSSTMYRAQ